MSTFLDKLKRGMNVQEPAPEAQIEELETKTAENVKPVQKRKRSKKSEVKPPALETSSLQDTTEKLEVKELKEQI